MQPLLPPQKFSLPHAGWCGALIRHIVGNPRKRIHRSHVRTHGRGKQARRDGKILVMRLRQALACVVRARRATPGRRDTRAFYNSASLMRDLVAALVALALLAAALSLATTLHFWRRRRERAHESERAAGRTIVAEIPVGDELRLFTEDEHCFYYGQAAIDKRCMHRRGPRADQRRHDRIARRTVSATRYARPRTTRQADVIRGSPRRDRERSLGRRD